MGLMKATRMSSHDCTSSGCGHPLGSLSCQERSDLGQAVEGPGDSFVAGRENQKTGPHGHWWSLTSLSSAASGASGAFLFIFFFFFFSLFKWTEFNLTGFSCPVGGWGGTEHSPLALKNRCDLMSVKQAPLLTAKRLLLVKLNGYLFKRVHLFFRSNSVP